MAKPRKSTSSNSSKAKAAADKNTQMPETLKAETAKVELKANSQTPKPEAVKPEPKAQPEQPKADNTTQEKPLTMIQAAHKVLAESKTNMTCLEIVKAMKAQNLWQTKTGLTPQNTLNAAINRDIKKGNKLFAKPEKGKYAAAS